MRVLLVLGMLALTGIVVFVVSGDTTFFSAAIAAVVVVQGVHYGREKLSHPRPDSN